MLSYRVVIFFFKQKTAYEMRISDWSSDVCSSDLHAIAVVIPQRAGERAFGAAMARYLILLRRQQRLPFGIGLVNLFHVRSEEHTSELQSLMRISYAVFCLQKKKNHISRDHTSNTRMLDAHKRKAESRLYNWYQP